MYINPENKYPRFIGDIQLEHPNHKEGDKLPKGWREVQPTQRPEPVEGKVIYEDFPTEVDGVMTQNWQIRDMTAEEIERRDAPKRAKEKLIGLGFTEAEIQALVIGLVR